MPLGLLDADDDEDFIHAEMEYEYPKLVDLEYHPNYTLDVSHSSLESILHTTITI